MTGRGSAARAGWTLLVLLTLLLPSAVSAQVDDQVRVTFSRAEMLFRGGDMEGARPLLDRVIEALTEVERRQPADDLLLRRALLYRVRQAWDQGERNRVDEDLDLLLTIDPAIDLSAEAVPTELADRLEQRRDRRIGYLQVALFPQDADVRIDGAPLEDPSRIVPVAAGVHRVEASRPGYASASQEVDVRAGRTEGVGFELQRTSATISIATHPSGAAIRVDEELIGRTEPGGAEGVSEPFRIVGLLPGTHRLEVTLEDHRSFQQQVDIPALADYDLGVLRLELALGVLVLRDLPGGASVSIDGREVEVERQVGSDGRPMAVGAARISLPVGSHELRIATPAGVFETVVDIGDGDTLGVDVAPEPGIAYLGVAGGETLDRQAVDDAIDGALQRPSGWFLLDRRDRLAGLGRLPDGADDLPGWERLQRSAARLEPGAALFALATLPEQTERADRYTLWIQAAPPGPVRPWKLEVQLGETGGLDELVRALESPLPPGRAWLGASFMDTDLASGLRVLDVEAGAPAGQAGLRPGDLLLTVDGRELGRASQLVDILASAEPFQALAFDLERDGARMAVPLRLGASPVVPTDPADLPPAPILWSAAVTGQEDPEATVVPWVLQLHQGLALLRTGDAAGAADVLARIQVPGDPPFGQPAVDYWLGIALLSRPEPLLEDARAALQRALNRPGARLEHNDGPFVAPRARARLDRLAADDRSGAGDGEG